MNVPESVHAQPGQESTPGETVDLPESGARRRKPLLGLAQIAGVVALVVAAVIYSQDRPGTDARAAAAAPANAPSVSAVPVTLFQPETTSQTLQVQATGSIVVRTYVSLTPQVTGQVVAISPALRAGGTYRAGEELLRIERSDFQLALDQANADVAAAVSALKLQQAESDAARANYALLHPGQPVPPLVAKVPQIEQAEARLAAAQARADIAALDLSRISYALPFDGRITETSAEVGQVITRGQPFGQAFALDAVEAVVPVAPADLELLMPAEGRVAHVQSGDTKVDAVVERVSAELDSRSRFARLFLSLADHELLKPGTFVDAVIEGPTIAHVFVLPAAAEQTGGEVWLVREDGTLESYRPTTRGRSEAGWIVDAFDFEAGVVLGSVPGGREGLAVRPVETSS